MLFGVNVPNDSFFLSCLPEREFVGCDEEVDRFFLKVKLGNNGVGSGIDHKVECTLESDSSKETHIDIVFDVGEHVCRHCLKRDLISGEHLNVVERFFGILLRYNDTKFLAFSLEMAKNVLNGMAVIVNENGFLVGFNSFGKLGEMDFVFVGFADEFVNERDDFLSIC